MIFEKHYSEYYDKKNHGHLFNDNFLREWNFSQIYDILTSYYEKNNHKENLFYNLCIKME